MLLESMFSALSNAIASATMNDLIYLDTETTGLDPDKHEVWEIAWAVNDEQVQSVLVPHSLTTADPEALELNGYWSRAGVHVGNPLPDLELRILLKETTIVCANPTFDRMFLRKRWGMEPWHYRSVDIASVAMGILGHERPRGLKDIATDLRELGYDIPEPDHSAAKDVETLREAYRALWAYRRRPVYS